VIAVVIGVLAVLVIAAIIWARVSASRSENKSVETYEHALGVLGEVSKRTESTGFRILPHEETGRPHVAKRTDSAGRETGEKSQDAKLRAQAPLASRRLPPAGEPKLRFSGPGRPLSEPDADGSGDEVVETGVPVAGAGSYLGSARAPVPDSARGHSRVLYDSAADRRRQVLTRRIATASAATVAVAAVVIASIYLSSGGGGRGALSPTTTTTHRSGGGVTTTSTNPNQSTTTTTLPTSLKPTSTSPVTFAVPARSYTLAFQATGGPCWVGIEASTAGPWLFSETLAAGQAATYKGSGTLIVRLGAPVHFYLTVDGLKALLPTYTQAYSLDLVPTST
jgi:hypothetical protein